MTPLWYNGKASKAGVTALGRAKIDMMQSRFKLVVVLLLVILLLASLVFGLLTYWLDPQVLRATSGLSWVVGP